MGFGVLIKLGGVCLIMYCLFDVCCGLVVVLGLFVLGGLWLAVSFVGLWLCGLIRFIGYGYCWLFGLWFVWVGLLVFRGLLS